MTHKQILDLLPSEFGKEHLHDKMAASIYGDPKLPQKAFTDRRLFRALVDPDAPIDDLIDYIKSDPGLNIKIIRMANSPTYRGQNEIECFEDGYHRLGIAPIRNLIYSDKMKSTFKQFRIRINWRHFWLHAILTAQLSEKICSFLISSKNFGYINGLLHDCAILIIKEYFPHEENEIQAYIQQDFTRDQAEREVFGFDHAHISGVLGVKWKFPYASSLGTYFHHTDPNEVNDEKARDYALALRIAEKISDQLPISTYDPSSEDSPEILDLQPFPELIQLPDELHQSIMNIDLEKQFLSALDLTATLQA